MKKFKIKLQRNQNVFIHNDLGNAAYHFKDRFDTWDKNNSGEGISLEIMAGLAMLAFTVEARINFLGYELFDKWPERDSFYTKLGLVSDKLGIDADQNKNPYCSIKDLKEFRDTLAHGKPISLSDPDNNETIMTQDEIDNLGYLTADWEQYLTLEFFNQAYDDVEQIWREQLKLSKLSIIETLSGGGKCISIIQHL